MSDFADGEGSDPAGDARVKDLYMRYPYPSAEVDTGVALFALLDYVRYVLWPGRASLEGLRVLDAGCGTGQVAVQLARQYPEVQVVAIDISSASLEVARRRAAAAGLGDVVNVGDEGRLSFRQAALEDLDPQQQRFDYVISSGVLHHLADPVDGARRLARLLTPTGGIGVMLYAPHGRHGVYLLQEALRRAVGDRDLSQQVVVARRMLAGLPDGHPFKPAQFADQDWGDDAGLVDLLLHVRDRSFSVPQLFQLVEDSGLRVERFFNPLAYRPENHTGDLELKQQLASLDQKEGAVMAELLCGVMPMHAFFATRADHRPQRLAANDVTLFLMRPRRSPLFRWDDLGGDTAPKASGGSATGNDRSKARGNGAGQGKGKGMRPASAGFTLAERHTGVLSRSFELEPWIVKILRRCDGARTTQQIVEDPAILSQVPGTSAAEKGQRVRQLMSFLAQQEVLLFEV